MSLIWAIKKEVHGRKFPAMKAYPFENDKVAQARSRRSDAEEKGVSTVSVTGGVSANSRLREAFREAGGRRGVEVYFPELALCTDNAAMTAAAGYARIRRGEVSGLRLDVVPNAPLGG
jgi:tRNA A37 threonylcarbamoyltransferase TsaD